MIPWKTIRESIRNCRACQRDESPIFVPFKEHWPVLPQPDQKAILFISEAPPTNGGFWAIQSRNMKQDDLRGKLLPLLALPPSGSDHGLTAFRDSSYYLLQAFPRPLASPIGSIGVTVMNRLLDHPVKTHLRDQIAFFQPSAILALGRAASFAIAMLWPNSNFARAFREGGYKLQKMRRDDRCEIFEELHYPILAVTCLPSGQGWRNKHFWEKDIPLFVEKVHPLHGS